MAKRRAQLLDVLSRGPSSSREASRITGMSINTAASELSQMFYMGVVDRKDLKQERKRHTAYLYSIKRAE